MLVAKASTTLAIADLAMTTQSLTYTTKIARVLPTRVAGEGAGQEQPLAVVYTGRSIGPDLSEDLGALIENSGRYFTVTLAGPNIPGAPEITAELLSKAELLAFPGGPDVNRTLFTCEKFNDCGKNRKKYDNAIKYKGIIQDFVRNGGHYLGVCLGAYLANDIGFDLLPQGVHSGSEIERDGAPIQTDDDTVVEVDYRFSNGKVQNKRGVYFQEGAVITGLDVNSDSVVAQYTANDDVAASVTSYGKGKVGLVGFHPEADDSWYYSAGIDAPEDGVSYEIGLDFIEHIFQGR